MDAINISLDTLRPDRYEQITRRRGLKLAYDGLMAAITAGFSSVKLNCVVVKDLNDDELHDFAQLAVDYPIEVRFIEFMPFAGNEWASKKLVPFREMLESVRRRIDGLEPAQQEAFSVSKVYRATHMRGRIGFISSMSDDFCGGCNRIRVGADGSFKTCLFGRPQTSLRDLMRSGASDSELLQAIQGDLNAKPARHASSSQLALSSHTPMVKIGG